MKILQVIPFFPPAYFFGGSMQVAYDVSKELVKRGHEVVVYTSDANDLNSRLATSHQEKLNGIEVHRFKNASMFTVSKSKLFITPGMITELTREIQKFDVIHLQEYRAFQSVISHTYARKYRKPYVLQAHGSIRWTSRYVRNKIYDMLLGHRLLEDASKVIALSETEAQQYRNANVPEEKIEIIPNGIDLSKYANLPSKGSFKKKFGIDRKTRIILYIGRIHKSKGIDLLIKAYAQLVRNMSFDNAMLVVLGADDGYLGEARALVHGLNLSESVLFTGFIDFKDKLGALRDAAVFATPSFYGFPVSFIEACVAGVPIVTTTLGDRLEWVDRNVGYVTQPDPRVLAEALCEILSDKRLCDRFSKRATMLAKSRFSIEKIASRLLELYADITGV